MLRPGGRGSDYIMKVLCSLLRSLGFKVGEGSPEVFKNEGIHVAMFLEISVASGRWSEGNRHHKPVVTVQVGNGGSGDGEGRPRGLCVGEAEEGG